jgi:signal transduction histidine kinase
MQSFRLRLFVASALIVAVTLGVVMAIGWSRLLDVEIRRLDSRLCMEARRLASQRFGDDNLDRLETDMRAKLRLAQPHQLMLRFEPADAAARSLQSSQWLAGLSIDRLDWIPVSDPGADGRPAADQPAPAGRGRGGGHCALSSFSGADTRWRAALLVRPEGRGFVAADLSAARDELQGAVRSALAMALPAALVLTALAAWLLSSLTMRPVNRLRDAMRAVNRKALDQRLPNAGEDREFKELIASYNAMLDRLESSFRQSMRFSSDAAHELKTPLTVLQGRIEMAMGRTESDSVHSDLVDMLDETRRLAAITRKLLLLAQADAGGLAVQRVPLDLTAMLDELAADAPLLLTGQRLTSSIDRQLLTPGDALLLRQVFNNLISNAVAYCPPSGWIEITGRRQPGGIQVVFANACEPMAGDERARVFDRFFRGEAARRRHAQGSGLGLSLSREIARAHGGDLTLEPSPPTAVRLRLWLPSDDTNFILRDAVGPTMTASRS